MQRHSHVREEVETAPEERQAKTKWLTGHEGANLASRRPYGIRSGNIPATGSLIAQGGHKAADRAGVHQGAICTRLSLLIHAEAPPESLKEGAAQCRPRMFEREERDRLIEGAGTVEVLQDKTTWADVSSYSRRQGKSTPIGGLMGEITFGGNLQPLLPLFAWGMVLQVGKDTTKGNGVYTMNERVCLRPV